MGDAILFSRGIAEGEAPTKQARAADAHAAREAVEIPCRRDFERLAKLTKHQAGELGDPIDFDEFGPLWPEGEPEWFRNPLWAEWRRWDKRLSEGQDDAYKNGIMAATCWKRFDTIASRLGLSPVDQVKLRVVPDDSDDPLLKLLMRRRVRARDRGTE